MTQPVTISTPDEGASSTWVPPDACTLPTTEQPLRVAEFDALLSDALTGVEHTNPTVARFNMSGAPRLSERVQDLADRETSCCSFFTFAITSPGPSEVVMDVTVPAEHADVLSALTERAHRASHVDIVRRWA